MTLSYILKKIWREVRMRLPATIPQIDIDAVYDFYSTYPDFRTIEACAEKTGLNTLQCERIRRLLYKQRKLGLYYFKAKAPPQPYMRQYILKNFPQIGSDSAILEVGPGENPVFEFSQYPHWFGVDKFLKGSEIHFRPNAWAKNMYPKEKIVAGGYENLSDILSTTNLVGKFDLVVGSHSYEHTLLPIQSLKEIHKVLKPGGVLVLFVPDGFTQDINTKDLTHTLYMHKGMVEEFFHYAGGFTKVHVTTFRPNADLVISAQKM